MTRRHVIFVNRFYWPDETATAQLLRDLTTALARRDDFHVAVVTSRPEGDVTLSETWEGVHIRRVPSHRANSTSLGGRVGAFLTFHWRALRQVSAETRRGDTIVAMTDPPLLGVTLWIVAKLKGAALVHWVQDIYPEIAMTVLQQPLLGALKPLRNVAWRQASECVVPGADMAETILSETDTAAQVTVSANWPPAGVKEASLSEQQLRRTEWGLEGKFVAMYSGNLGRVHEFEALIAAAELLRHEDKFVFLFVGSGARVRAVAAATAARGLTNVRFLPAQPRSQLSESLSAADVHFVTLRAGAERSVFPSKLYGAAAVGRPILFVGNSDGELARLVQQGGLGYAFRTDEPARIVEVLRQLADDSALCRRIGAAGRNFVANNFPSAVDAWADVLAHCGAPR